MVRNWLGFVHLRQKGMRRALPFAALHVDKVLNCLFVVVCALHFPEGEYEALDFVFFERFDQTGRLGSVHEDELGL